MDFSSAMLFEVSSVVVVVVDVLGCKSSERGWSVVVSSKDRSRWSWCRWENFFVFEWKCFVADGATSEGRKFDRLGLLGRSKHEAEDDDVVEAGEMGVKVNDEDEQLEFVGLGQILGEFGGGKRSLSGWWIGLKWLWSWVWLLLFDEDEERRFKGAWVVNRWLFDSSGPGDGDSLEENEFHHWTTTNSMRRTENSSDRKTIHYHFQDEIFFHLTSPLDHRDLFEWGEKEWGEGRHQWNTFPFEIRRKWRKFIRWWWIAIRRYHSDHSNWTLRSTWGWS